MNTAGIDVGFSAVKALSSDAKVLFPSVVGTPQPETSYSLSAENGLAIRFGETESFVPVGETALLQSQYTSGSRDSGWVLQPEWRVLLSAALAAMFDRPYTRVGIVTGLPVYDWSEYVGRMRAEYDGVVLSFQKRGRARQEVEVKMRVITQPYGTLCDLMLDDAGKLLDNVWSTGLVAVVDIGGLTMNLLAVRAQEAISRQTLSDEFGLLPVLDNVRDAIRSDLRRYDPQTHEVSEALASGSFRYRGEDVDVMQYARPHLTPFLERVIRRVDEGFPEAGRFDAVALTGGGAAAIGQMLKSRMDEAYANVCLIDKPRWANTRGYLKLARRFWS